MTPCVTALYAAVIFPMRNSYFLVLISRNYVKCKCMFPWKCKHGIFLTRSNDLIAFHGCDVPLMLNINIDETTELSMLRWQSDARNSRKKVIYWIIFLRIYTSVYQTLRAGKTFDTLFSLPVYDKQYIYRNLINVLAKFIFMDRVSDI